MTAAVAPAAPGEDLDARTRAFLDRLAAANGLAALHVDDVVVERRVMDADGGVTVSLAPAREVLPGALAVFGEHDPAAPVAARPGLPPDVVAGHLMLHAMMQLADCSGYGARDLAAGVRVADGRWFFGVHATVGPLGGGAGVDLGSPGTALIGAGHLDSALVAVGQMEIVELRAYLFGFCLGTLGAMSGTGVFAFDTIASDV